MKSFLIAASLLFAVPVFAEPTLENPVDENVISITEDNVTVQETYNYNFGPVKKGKTATARFRLRNNGNYPFYINSITTSGKGFSHKENCGGLLWPGQSCRATVRFAPKQVGYYSGQLRFSLIGRESITVYLSGWSYNY